MLHTLVMVKQSVGPFLRFVDFLYITITKIETIQQQYTNTQPIVNVL